MPAVTLTATNWSDRPLRARVGLALTATRPSSPFARMVPRPEIRWSTIAFLPVPPGETLSRSFATDAALTADELHTLSAWTPPVGHAPAVTGPVQEAFFGNDTVQLDVPVTGGAQPFTLDLAAGNGVVLPPLEPRSAAPPLALAPGGPAWEGRAE